jgi:uncharacterized protein (DUF2062 family)
VKNPLSLDRLREQLRKSGRGLQNLRARDLSPERAASSVAVGLFVGSTPLYGFHLPICAGLSYVLGLDLLITYLAANISIAPVVPVMVFSQVQIGTLVLEGHWLSVSLTNFNWEEALQMTKRLFVGALLVGSALSAVGGLSTLWVTRRFKKRQLSEVDRDLREATNALQILYNITPPAHRHYVSTKLRMDPLTRELFLLARSGHRFGSLVDAGCGRGQFSLFLLSLQAADTVLGFDHDERKVNAACLAAREFGQHRASFHTGDLKTEALPQVDTILLLDVLHYLSSSDQSEVLKRMAQALNTRGYLVVRETNHRGSLGASFARFFERCARLIGANRGDRLVFRSAGDLENELTTLGFHVVRHAPKGALDNVLLVAQKAATGSEQPPLTSSPPSD